MPLFKRDIYQLREGSRQPPGWLGTGVQHLFCEERPRGLHLFILEKRSLQRGTYYCVQLPKGGVTEKTKPEIYREWRGNSHRLKQGKFHLNIRKTFFLVSMFKYWDQFSKEAVNSPSLEIEKKFTRQGPEITKLTLKLCLLLAVGLESSTGSFKCISFYDFLFLK